MPTAIERLRQLHEKMNRVNTTDWWVQEMNRLLFFEVDGLLHIEYYGREPWFDEDEEAMLRIYETLSLPEVANRIASLAFDGPDEGANGTRAWDFSPLLAQDVTFPELKTLIIEPSPLEYHNTTIVGTGYEESGQLAGWVAKAPRLVHLTAPSAPNAEFFEVGHQSLCSMRVDAGYDAHDFILNLSRSSTPKLHTLDFGEVDNFHLDLWEEGATPYEHYEALFRSKACPATVTLRNPNLAADQMAALKAMHMRGSIKVIRTSVGYVR
jgi:hypothetical protein